MKKVLFLIFLSILTISLVACSETKDLIYDGNFYYRVQDDYAEIYGLTEQGLELTYIEFPTKINGYSVKIGSYYGFGVDSNAARIESDNLEVVVIKSGIKVLTHALEKCMNLKYVIFLSDDFISMEGGFLSSGKIVVKESQLDWYNMHRGGGRFIAAKAQFYIDDVLYALSYDDQTTISAPDVPSKTGASFVGWSETKSSSDMFDFNQSSSLLTDIKLHAVWQNN